MKRNDFDVKGKKILVVGLGRSGIAACLGLMRLRTFLSDELSELSAL